MDPDGLEAGDEGHEAAEGQQEAEGGEGLGEVVGVDARQDGHQHRDHVRPRLRISFAWGRSHMAILAGYICSLHIDKTIDKATKLIHQAVI